MYILFAVGAALFAGLTTILSKIGIKDINSNLATGIRTGIILIFSWALVILAGKTDGLYSISGKTILFLAFSGMSTGGAWLCYFRALQLGNVGPVTAIDKSSTVIAILLAFIILGETITAKSIVAMLLLLAGTLLMIVKTNSISSEKKKSRLWLIYAFGAALFSALTAILGKRGVHAIASDLATAIRTIFVFICSWGIIFLKKENVEIIKISFNNWLFLIMSGLATGISWLCYYRALQLGPTSVVVPIDRLSIVITLLFSHFILKENIKFKSWIGLFLMIAGTLLLI